MRAASGKGGRCWLICGRMPRPIRTGCSWLPGRRLPRGHSGLAEGDRAEAGVGIGTLYRRFPAREDLVEAVYRNEVAHLCAASPELLKTLPPEEALSTWMEKFIDFMATKQGMADVLRVVLLSEEDHYVLATCSGPRSRRCSMRARPPAPYVPASTRTTC